MKPAVGQQLRRTKLCSKFFVSGECYDDCSFAHSSLDLRVAPDLRKTMLCTAWKHGKRCPDEDCRYAHGACELRATADLFKTQMCNWHAKGRCKFGDRCRHAHGAAEMRQPEEKSEPATGKVVYAV